MKNQGSEQRQNEGGMKQITSITGGNRSPNYHL